MRILFWPILTLALYTLQTSWFLFFHTSQSPDLLLILILLVALEEGPAAGGLLGCGVGILQDVVTFSFFGYHLVTRTLIGLAVGAMRENIFKDQLSTFLILVAIISGFLKVLHVLFLMVYQREIFTLWPLAWDAGKYIGWNVVCAIPMWIICKVLLTAVQRRESRYYKF